MRGTQAARLAVNGGSDNKAYRQLVEQASVSHAPALTQKHQRYCWKSD